MVRPGDLVYLRGDPKLYGRVGDWLPDRGRWGLHLSSGVQAAARADQLEAVALAPGAQVKISLPRADIPRASVVEYLPERDRWAVRLENGMEAAAHASQMTLLAPAGAEPIRGDGHAQSNSGCCQGRKEDVPAEGCCKDRVEAAGAEDSSCQDQSHHGCAVNHSSVWSGVLSPEMQVLVELVAKTGLGDWGTKLAAITSRLGPHGVSSTPQELEWKWQQVAPTVRAKLEERPEMPCGHSCVTCPTRHDCQLEGVLDMEDYGAGGGPATDQAGGVLIHKRLKV